MIELCHEHSGCVTDIENLKDSNSKLWDEISTVRNKVDTIMVRLNVILGCIVVSVIMLAVNLTFKVV